MDEYALLKKPVFHEAGLRARLQEGTLQMELRYKYMADSEEMEYWRSVFGENKVELEPESDLPF
jgi:hypothetical protein